VVEKGALCGGCGLPLAQHCSNGRWTGRGVPLARPHRQAEDQSDAPRGERVLHFILCHAQSHATTLACTRHIASHAHVHTLFYPSRRLLPVHPLTSMSMATVSGTETPRRHSCACAAVLWRSVATTKQLQTNPFHPRPFFRSQANSPIAHPSCVTSSSPSLFLLLRRRTVHSVRLWPRRAPSPGKRSCSARMRLKGA
jgi:hypothetical protein